VLPSVLSAAELTEINGYVDSLGPIKPHGQWYDNVEVHSYYGNRGLYSTEDTRAAIDDGFNLQHIYEAGPAFEALIDHEEWMPWVRHFMGRGEPFMHELFLNVRGKGGYIGVHSGGPRFDGRGWGVSAAGAGGDDGQQQRSMEWSVGYLSMIIALDDIGPGDGATVVVPSSHKSMIKHPVQQQMQTEGSQVDGGQEVHLKAGECLIFNDRSDPRPLPIPHSAVLLDYSSAIRLLSADLLCLGLRVRRDSLCHGAAARVNEGERRVLCFRYLPKQTATNRWGYLPSPELMARLTPARRAILTERDYKPSPKSHVPPGRRRAAAL
jgi:hypothetical protein